jgi:hypothetical protein
VVVVVVVGVVVESLDPKGFRIFRVLIQKVFVSLDPKGFRIFWIKWREIQLLILIHSH